MPPPGSDVTASSSSDGSLVALHVPSPPSHGSTQRLTVRLYDAAVSLQVRATLVASVEIADGYVSELALDETFCAARLKSNDPARPDKAVVWDLDRGVVACTVSSPAGATFHSAAINDGTLHLLALYGESGKVQVLQHDLASSGSGAGKLKRKVKCGSVSVEGGALPRLGLAVSPSGKRLAARIGGVIKVLDSDTGEKVAKCKIRGDAGAANFDSAVCPVLFSTDAALVGTVTSTGLALFDATEGGKARHTATARGAITSASVRNIEGGKYAILAVDPRMGVARLFEAESKGKGRGDGVAASAATLLPGAGDGNGIVAATFHASSPGSRVVALSLPAGTAPRAAALGQVHLAEASYRDEDGNLLQGDVRIGGDAAKSDGEDGGGDAEGKGAKGEKRKSLPSGELVLGPGEGGAESLTVTDRSAKRSKPESAAAAAEADSGSEADEFALPDIEDEEEGGGATGTIADRLARLTAEFEQDDSDSDAEIDEEAASALFGPGSGKRRQGKATSESLATLLRQALSSNDDTKLEVALHVGDKKVIENSIQALAREDEEAETGDSDEAKRGGMIIALLSKLVTRLARKPGRAEELSVWIRTVLLVLISGSSGPGRRMGREQKRVAASLGPLRNLLNERVESLPHLLRLEGRLSLLGQQL